MNRYTGELWHYGIPNMHWHVRRYQNYDGTLTPAGRERYGYGPPREKKVEGTGSGLKKAGKRLGTGIKRAVVTKIAEKMPFLFEEDELTAFEDRLRKENAFRQNVANKKNIKKSMKGENFLKNLLESSVKTATNNVVNEVTRKAANRLAETTAEKRVRRSKEEADLRKNFAEASEKENKRALDDDISDYVSTESRIRANERKMSEIQIKANDLFEKKNNESDSEYQARIRDIQAGTNSEYNKLFNQYNNLTKSTDKMVLENDERRSDLRLRRDYLDRYAKGGNQKGGDKNVNWNKVKEIFEQMGYDPEDFGL